MEKVKASLLEAVAVAPALQSQQSEELRRAAQTAQAKLSEAEAAFRAHDQEQITRTAQAATGKRSWSLAVAELVKHAEIIEAEYNFLKDEKEAHPSGQHSPDTLISLLPEIMRCVMEMLRCVLEIRSPKV